MENAGLIPLPQDDLELQSEVEIPSDIGDDTNLEAEDEMTKSTDKPELTAEEQQELKNALFTATVEGNAYQITQLIDRGAEVNAADILGNTPLMEAVRRGYTVTAQILIKNDANVNVTNDDGDTPLMWAASRGHTEIAQMLIENGANVNVAARSSTPLMWAASRGHTEIAQMLIENGADINITNKNGDTALMIADSNGVFYKTSDLIREHQKRLNHLAAFLKSEYIDRTPNRCTQAEKDNFLKKCDSYNESNIKDALVRQGISDIDVTTVYNQAKKEASDQKWNALLGGIDKERKPGLNGQKPVLSHIDGENIFYALPSDVLSIVMQYLSKEDNKKARNDIRKATLRAPQTELNPPSTAAAVARAGGDIHDQAIEIGKGLARASGAPQAVDPNDHRKPSASYSPSPSPKKGPNR